MATEKREFIDPNELMRYINEKHSYAGLPMAAHICTMELLTYAPRVDAVEVVHGRWIVEDADSGEHGCYKAYMIVECSHCGQTHEVETGQFGWVYGEAFPFNFCPNCGAKMDCDGNG